MLFDFAVAIGTLAQWLTVGAVVMAAYVLQRSGGGTAINSLETANRVLEKRVHDLEQKTHEDELVIEHLRASRDFNEALNPIVDMITKHEARAMERHDAILNVLGLIADRLGPDPNGLYAE